MNNNIRNITIIAHVDHGKTTLIDNLMKQSGSFRENEVVDERLMDSGELEKERGITILAKPASINWKDSRVNIIDTPGHRDFAAEVERVLSMADGALLLIDSAEGVMPQTKFVLSKALKQGLKPIVVINKLDKADQRANEVLDETFDLFVSLDANEEQLDFPVLYASGRSGWASKEVDGARENLHPLLDLIIEHVKPAELDKTKPFAMLSTLLYADSFLGRSLVGRISQGTAKANQPIKAINLKGEKVDEGKLTKIFRYEGTKKVPIEIGEAGDIVVIAGLEKANVADTICDLEVNNPIAATPIDPPTMSITIKQLKYLCAVADYQHFTKAADASFVTQSTLSAAINELELQLGVKVFERNRRSVLVTPLGKKVLVQARIILGEVEDLLSLAEEFRDPLSSELRLGVIPTVGPFLLPPMLSDLRIILVKVPTC